MCVELVILWLVIWFNFTLLCRVVILSQVNYVNYVFNDTDVNIIYFNANKLIIIVYK